MRPSTHVDGTESQFFHRLLPSVAGRQRNADALFLQLLANVLEPLVLAEGDRTAVALALLLARRILYVRLHERLAQAHSRMTSSPTRTSLPSCFWWIR